MTGGWSLSRLGDVCTVIAGQSPKATFYNEDRQGLPFYQGKKEFTERLIGRPTKWTTFVTKEAEAGDILMSVRAPVGPINQATEKICIGRGLAAIRPHGVLNRDYVWYALLWLQPTIEGNAGAVFESFNKVGIERLRIPVPPMEEQRRVVAVLDEALEGLDRARVHVEENLRNTSELFATIIDTEFSKIFANGDARELQSLCTNRGITYGVIKLGDHISDGVPCLRTSNLRSLAFDLGGLKRISPELSQEYSRTVLEGSELLVSVRGTLGGVAVVPTSMIGWNVSREVAMVAIDSKRIDPEFAAFYLTTSRAKAWLTDVVTGATYRGINLADLRKLVVPCPSPTEQQELVQRLSEAKDANSQLLEACGRKLIDLADFRQSLLQRAFSGELT